MPILLMSAPHSREQPIRHVDGQLVLKADQSTTYTKNDVINILAPKVVKADVDIELATKANLSEMLIALSQKHPTITSATDLTVNKIITNSVEPQAGTTYLQLRTNEVRFGTTLYASITSTKASFWTPVYISQGLELNTGLTVGYSNPIVARFTVDAATGNVVSFGTIECYNGITTYGILHAMT